MTTQHSQFVVMVDACYCTRCGPLGMSYDVSCLGWSALLNCNWQICLMVLADHLLSKKVIEVVMLWWCCIHATVHMSSQSKLRCHTRFVHCWCVQWVQHHVSLLLLYIYVQTSHSLLSCNYNSSSLLKWYACMLRYLHYWSMCVGWLPIWSIWLCACGGLLPLFQSVGCCVCVHSAIHPVCTTPRHM